MYTGGYYGQIYDGPSSYGSRRAIGSFQQGNQGYIVATSPTVITTITIVTVIPPRATTLAVIDVGLARAASRQANIEINANPGLTDTRTAPPLAGAAPSALLN